MSGIDQVSVAESWENPGYRDKAGQSISLKCVQERSLLEGGRTRPRARRDPSQGWRGDGGGEDAGLPEKDQD